MCAPIDAQRGGARAVVPCGLSGGRRWDLAAERGDEVRG